MTDGKSIRKEKILELAGQHAGEPIGLRMWMQIVNDELRSLYRFQNTLQLASALRSIRGFIKEKKVINRGEYTNGSTLTYYRYTSQEEQREKIRSPKRTGEKEVFRSDGLPLHREQRQLRLHRFDSGESVRDPTSASEEHAPEEETVIRCGY